MDDCHFWLHHKIDPKLNTPFVVCSNDQGRVHFLLFWNGFVGPHYDQSNQIIEL
jgi:hypothetical protein